MAKKVIVFLADGFEEVEALTPIDYLRRAGIELTSASIGEGPLVKGSHGVQVAADTRLSLLLERGALDAGLWDAVILPGGLPGADNLAASKDLGKFLLEMTRAGKWVCAICASPARVLFPLGILSGKRFTCFPGEEKKILAQAGTDPGAPESMNPPVRWQEERVVVDGALITSRGAGTAGEFACAVIESLLGPGEGKKIAGQVLLA